MLIRGFAAAAENHISRVAQIQGERASGRKAERKGARMFSKLLFQIRIRTQIRIRIRILKFEFEFEFLSSNSNSNF